MAWFSRTKRQVTGQPGSRPCGRPAPPQRTAQAENALEETEHKIHELANQVREDLKGSA